MSEDEKKLKTGMVGPHQKKVSWASWIDSAEQIIGMYQSRGQSQFEQGVMAPRVHSWTDTNSAQSGALAAAAPFLSPARRKKRDENLLKDSLRAQQQTIRDAKRAVNRLKKIIAGQITVKMIDSEANWEVRRIMLERFGVERYVREASSTVNGKDK